jgi:hypothetical protein
VDDDTESNQSKGDEDHGSEETTMYLRRRCHLPLSVGRVESLGSMHQCTYQMIVSKGKLRNQGTKLLNHGMILITLETSGAGEAMMQK